jgi:hypothetical protein
MIAMGDAYGGSAIRVPRPPAPESPSVAPDGKTNRWGMPGPFRLAAVAPSRAGKPRLVFAAPPSSAPRLAAA